MTEMDFSGFDDASLGALHTDLAGIGLEDATEGIDLPDPIDDADVADVADVADLPDLDDVADLDVGPDGTGWADTAPPIVASDGTVYDSYGDFLRGPGRG